MITNKTGHVVESLQKLNIQPTDKRWIVKNYNSTKQNAKIANTVFEWSFKQLQTNYICYSKHKDFQNISIDCNNYVINKIDCL